MMLSSENYELYLCLLELEYSLYMHMYMGGQELKI
jgi:hypothetical protein